MGFVMQTGRKYETSTVYKWKRSFISHVLPGIAVDSMSLQLQLLAWLLYFMWEPQRCESQAPMYYTCINTDIGA